jgi:DNA polymerase I
MQILDVTSSMIDHGFYKEPKITICGVGGELREIIGFFPYFYIHINKEYKNDIIDTLHYMNLKYEVVYKFLPMYYQTEKSMVIKIYADDPRNIRNLRNDVKDICGVISVLEADILYKNRFLIDNGIFGMGYIDENNKPVAHDGNEDLKILAFDIEVLPPESLEMPTSDKDQIIVISFAFSHKYCGYNSMVCIVGNGNNYEDVSFFPDEKTLLWYFNEVVNEYDPDIISGYNVNGFDFEYINVRQERNYLKPIIGRNKSKMWIRKGFQNTTISIFGRVIFDLLPLVKANYNYASYNLKTISHELLKNDKIDLSMQQMRNEYTNGNYKNTIDYARHDSVLVLELLYKTKFLDKYIAISKLTGLLLQDCVNSGQSQKIEMKLMREFLKEDRLMAMRPIENEEMNDDNVKYGGATVFNPVIGLSKDVVVLDYKSLYPTIMISQNYSYDTIIKDENKNLYKDEDINKAVVGGWFVKPEIKMGIIPKVLTELLNERIRIKGLMKAATGSEKDYLDARQYALKILLNSFYGYSGYTRARLFEVGIAAAVTSFGRQNIEETKKFIEHVNERLQIKNNYTYKVIYGDTDSVFVEVRNKDIPYGEILLDDLKKIGEFLGKERSKELPAPMELLYEKIAKRIIFEAKKKYVFLNYEQDKNGKWENKIKASGVETKRRDWSKIVGKTLTKCIEEILLNNNTNAAIKVVKDAVSYIEQLEYHNPSDLDLLVLTKKYQKTIDKYKVVPIQIKVAQKMIKNHEQLNIGDRISYLIVRGDGKYNERAQSVNEIIKSNLEIDRNYYINTQLIPPIERFFNCLNIKKELYYNGTINLKKDIIILKTNGKNVMQKNLFSYEE